MRFFPRVIQIVIYLIVGELLLASWTFTSSGPVSSRWYVSLFLSRLVSLEGRGYEIGNGGLKWNFRETLGLSIGSVRDLGRMHGAHDVQCSWQAA